MTKILFIVMFALALSMSGLAQDDIPAKCLQKEVTVTDGNWTYTSSGGGSYEVRQEPGEKSLMQIDHGKQTILLGVPVGVDMPAIEILGVIKNSRSAKLTPGSGWSRVEFVYQPIKSGCKEVRDSVLEAVKKSNPDRKVTY